MSNENLEFTLCAECKTDCEANCEGCKTNEKLITRLLMDNSKLQSLVLSLESQATNGSSFEEIVKLKDQAELSNVELNKLLCQKNDEIKILKNEVQTQVRGRKAIAQNVNMISQEYAGYRKAVAEILKVKGGV